ncbi:hypothetical protein MMC18_005920 [Xylographa bjoerkii]|nr:hypothetical protein [Xylographa bjoerkii]
MASSPRIAPATDSPISPTATTSPQTALPTTPDSSKEAKQIVRPLSAPLSLPIPQSSRASPTTPPPSPPFNPPNPNARLLTTPQAILHAKISALEAQLAATQAQIDAIKPQLRSPSPGTTVQQHIALLHTYNEIRDVGQGLLGMVAENRGVRVRDVYGEYGVEEGD